MSIRNTVSATIVLMIAATPAGGQPPGTSDRVPFQPLRVIDADDGTLQWVQFSPDGKSVAACGDRFVQTYDIESGDLVRRFAGHEADIFRFSFSPDGKHVASGSRDATVRVWEADTGQRVAVLTSHTDRVIGVKFSADSRWLASTSADGTIFVWDCESWEAVANARADPNTNAMFLDFSPDGKMLATSEYRGGVRAYNFDDTSLSLRHAMSHDGGEMTSHVVFAPSGDAFLTSGWDRTIRMWDARSGKQIWKRPTPPYARCFEASVFSPDGSIVYSVTRDETIQSRQAATGEIIQGRRWNDTVRGFAINPDGSLLATSGNGGAIKIWSTAYFE